MGLGPGLASQGSRGCGVRRLRLGQTAWGQLVPQAAPRLFPFKPGLDQSILYTVTRTQLLGPAPGTFWEVLLAQRTH